MRPLCRRSTTHTHPQEGEKERLKSSDDDPAAELESCMLRLKKCRLVEGDRDATTNDGTYIRVDYEKKIS